MPTVESNSFRHWMRRYGIRLWFISLLALVWSVHSISGVFAGEDAEIWPGMPHPSSLYDVIRGNSSFLDWLMVNLGLELGFYQVTVEDYDRSAFVSAIWLFLRLYTFSELHLIFYQACTCLIFQPPNPEMDIAEVENGRDHAAIGRHRNSASVPKSKEVGAHRPKVHCLCVRLVTRGDKAAQGLIYNSIRAALTLFSQICDCEHLKIHIVTQTQFITNQAKEKWTSQGATEVREFFVPQAYKTPKGTLFKGRNICYWQEIGGVGSDCDETRSWVLSLDEEAVVLRSLVTSFAKDVLQSEDESKIGFALAPAIMDVKTGSISFWTKALEARFMAWNYALLKCESRRKHGGRIYFHGGAFFVRASVDRALGNDWGPKASVAEDFATGIAATEQRIKFKYLSGWFVEGTSEDLSGFITHRARDLRGHLYNIYYTPMSLYQKVAICHHLIPGVLLPFTHLLLVGVLLTEPLYLPTPAPQLTLMDLTFLFTIPVLCSGYAFGASYMELTNMEIVTCTLLSPIMVIFVAPIVDALVVLKALQRIFEEWKSGSTTFQVTAKPTQQKAEVKNGKID